MSRWFIMLKLLIIFLNKLVFYFFELKKNKVFLIKKINYFISEIKIRILFFRYEFISKYNKDVNYKYYKMLLIPFREVLDLNIRDSLKILKLCFKLFIVYIFIFIVLIMLIILNLILKKEIKIK